MFIIQNTKNWIDTKCINSIAELIRNYPEFSEDTIYDFFSRQKLSEVEYKGYRILKRDLIKSKRKKNENQYNI